MGKVGILKFNSPMAADEMQPEVVWSKFEEYGWSSQNKSDSPFSSEKYSTNY